MWIEKWHKFIIITGNTQAIERHQVLCVRAGYSCACDVDVRKTQNNMAIFTRVLHAVMCAGTVKKKFEEWKVALDAILACNGTIFPRENQGSGLTFCARTSNGLQPQRSGTFIRAYI